MGPLVLEQIFLEIRDYRSVVNKKTAGKSTNIHDLENSRL